MDHPIVSILYGGRGTLELPLSLSYAETISKVRSHFGITRQVSLYLDSNPFSNPVTESKYPALSRETRMFEVREHIWIMGEGNVSNTATNLVPTPPVLIANDPAPVPSLLPLISTAPATDPAVVPAVPAPTVSATPDLPPPYVRNNPDRQRKVKFTVTTQLGDQTTLSAKRCVKVIQIFESACKTLKLQAYQCTLEHAGRTYGVMDMVGISLAAIDIDNDDNLRITWEDATVHSYLWIRSPGIPSVTPATSSRASARISVGTSSEWSFGALSLSVPINASRPQVPGEDVDTSRSIAAWAVRTCPDYSLRVSNNTTSLQHLSWELKAKPILRSLPLIPSSCLQASTGSPVRVAQLPVAPITQLNITQAPPVPTAADQKPLLHWAEMSPLALITTMVTQGYNLLLPLFALNATPRELVEKAAQSLTKTFVTPAELGQDNDPLDPHELYPALQDHNSVLLKGHEVETYLWKVFEGVGIPGPAAEAFISQKLPQISHHKYVAVRFLSKDVYTQISTLRILPEPDVVVRAFLLYGGIPSEEVNDREWDTAKSRGEMIDARMAWREVILGKDAKVQDHGPQAFELSWMEAYPDDF